MLLRKGHGMWHIHLQNIGQLLEGTIAVDTKIEVIQIKTQIRGILLRI